MLIMYGIIVILLVMGTINVGTAVFLGAGIWLVFGNGRAYLEELIRGLTTHHEEPPQEIGFSKYTLIQKDTEKNLNNGKMRFIGTIPPPRTQQTSRNLPTIRR